MHARLSTSRTPSSTLLPGQCFLHPEPNAVYLAIFVQKQDQGESGAVLLNYKSPDALDYPRLIRASTLPTYIQLLPNASVVPSYELWDLAAGAHNSGRASLALYLDGVGAFLRSAMPPDTYFDFDLQTGQEVTGAIGANLYTKRWRIVDRLPGEADRLIREFVAA